MDLELLKKWFLEEKRDLPWRQNNTPYQVWISEVMLQQTQVSVVLAYFERWMERFPTIRHLAGASLEEVMKMWEGLGYYSRARFIHENAKIICDQFQGVFPSNKEALSQLKGLGPYTIGAILSFAFHQKAAAVDGNVIRVISRLFLKENDVSERKAFEEVVNQILPDKEPWIVMEALIELGAKICKKKPVCRQCPLKEMCHAYQKGEESFYPKNKKKIKIEKIERDVAVIIYNQSILLRKGVLGKVMGGLYEFPYIQKGEKFPFNFNLYKQKELNVVKHGFTRFQATLYPTLYFAETGENIEDYEWISFKELPNCTFSSGHRRILKEVLSENFTY